MYLKKIGFKNHSEATLNDFDLIESGLVVVYYDDESLGHAPPPKDITLSWLRRIV